MPAASKRLLRLLVEEGGQMEDPFRRRWHWWQEDPSGTLHQWKNRQWQPRKDMRFPPPPRWGLGLGQLRSEPLIVYLLGVLAALLALVITVTTVGDSSIAAVLAPVIGVIGAFTGHAAGHAGAVRAIKEGQSSGQISRAPAAPLQPVEPRVPEAPPETQGERNDDSQVRGAHATRQSPPDLRHGESQDWN
jgi:hypothetical protein